MSVLSYTYLDTLYELRGSTGSMVTGHQITGADVGLNYMQVANSVVGTATAVDSGYMIGGSDFSDIFVEKGTNAFPAVVWSGGVSGNNHTPPPSSNTVATVGVAVTTRQDFLIFNTGAVEIKRTLPAANNSLTSTWALNMNALVSTYYEFNAWKLTSSGTFNYWRGASEGAVHHANTTTWTAYLPLTTTRIYYTRMVSSAVPAAATETLRFQMRETANTANSSSADVHFSGAIDSPFSNLVDFGATATISCSALNSTGSGGSSKVGINIAQTGADAGLVTRTQNSSSSATSWGTQYGFMSTIGTAITSTHSYNFHKTSGTSTTGTLTNHTNSTTWVTFTTGAPDGFLTRTSLGTVSGAWTLRIRENANTSNTDSALVTMSAGVENPF